MAWVRTASGGRVPCDPVPVRGLPFTGQPDEGRKWAQGYTADGRNVRLYLAETDGAAIPEWKPTLTIQVSHFATCPNAKDWKGKGKRGGA